MNSRTSNLYIGNINPGATSERLSATTSSAVSLATLHTDTDYVVIDVQTYNVLVTFDGTTATATNGHLLVKDKELIVLTKNAAAGASFIGSGGTAIVYAEQFVD